MDLICNEKKEYLEVTCFEGGRGSKDEVDTKK